MHSATETESEGKSDSEAEKEDVPPTNEGTDQHTIAQSDIVAADLLQVIFNLRATLTWCPKLKVFTRTWRL